MPASPTGVAIPGHATGSRNGATGLDGARTPTEVHAAVAALHDREAAITSRLDALLASQTELAKDLGRLDVLQAGLGAQVVAARSIGSEMLSPAADTAERLSNRVKELDMEKQRVQDTLGVVEQVAELKACVNGVVGSIGAPQDWEAAAAYLSRASKIPDKITKGAFASLIVPSVEVPDPPWTTLENARESLCGLFFREFERAANDGDGTKVTRFFKLFPPISRADVGLDVYGRYVCQGVAGTARAVLKDGVTGHGTRDGFFYVNALTKLFEHIAQIVESHGSLVERHYGSGKMARVIERLQMEADVQGGIILDTWSDERMIERRLTDVKSYPFSFLVQSFLPQPPARGGTPRLNTPSAGVGNNPRNSEDEGVNMKEVDSLLSEIAVMLGRWSLYTQFLSAKCMDQAAEEAPLVMPDLLKNSNLCRKVSSKLTTPYAVMSTFFFRRSVEKAFQLDEYPSGLSLSLNKQLEGNAPFIILAVDDVMYIVDNVIRRSLATSQRDVIASVVQTIGRVLGSDFVGMIQRKMRDESYPKPVVPGGLPPEEKIIHFIVLINSLDMSNEYLHRVVSSRVSRSEDRHSIDVILASPLRDTFPFDHDVAFVAATLLALEKTFVAKSTELLNEGIQVLFNQVVKLQMRPILSDTFRDADYTLTEEEFEKVAEQDDETAENLREQVFRRFELGWNQLMKALSRLMTSETYSSLLDLTARYLSKVLEKRILTLSGKATAIGAYHLEKDLTAIINTVSKGKYGVREAFAKVTQLLMVANMEEDEWGELLKQEDSEAAFPWILTDEERRKARNLVHAR